MGCVCPEDLHDPDCGYGPKTDWFNCDDPGCGSCPRPREDDHHRMMELKRDASPEDLDAAVKVVTASPADHKAADRLLGRWQSPWLPPTEERAPINVHPIVITELRALLMSDPDLKGVGYSEFIMRSIRQWQADHA